MRFPTLLSAASFAFALASPTLAQQPNDMREEIRRIVREEVRAALREAMQEMHGVAPKAAGEAPKAKKEPARPDQPILRRLAQPGKVESIELRELETEMKELEKTLERLQGEIGKKVGGQLRELQPLLRGKVLGGNLEGMKVRGGNLEGLKIEMDGVKFDLEDVTKGIQIAPGVRVLTLNGDGEPVEVGGTRVHVFKPDGQNVIEVGSIKFEDVGEQRTEKKEKKEKKEAKELPTIQWLEVEGETKAEESKPKAKKTVKAAKAPVAVGTLTLPVLDEAMVVPAAGDGCNCVIVIRCENGKCTVETNCDGAQQAPLQIKTLSPKVMNKAKGSDNEDCTLQIKVDTGCCDETPKAKGDCCTGGACTDCAPAKSGCCDETKTEVKKPEAKVTDKKKLIS